MICPKCGATIEGGYRYLTCSNCGRTFDSTLFEDAEEPVAASVVEIVEEAPAEPVVVVNHEINAQVLVEDSDTLETGSNVSLSSDNNDLLQETVGDPQIEPIEESEFEQIAEDNYQEDSVEEVFEEQIATAEELENDNNPIVEQPEVHDEGSIDQLNNRPDIELEKETTVEETVIIDAPKDISAHGKSVTENDQIDNKATLEDEKKTVKTNSLIEKESKNDLTIPSSSGKANKVLIATIILFFALLLGIFALVQADKRSVNGIVENPNGVIAMYSNGEVDTSYTGFAEDENGIKYYVEDGYVDGSYTGLVKDDDGRFLYVNEGVFDESFTGVVEKNTIYYYIEDGQQNTNYTGIYEDEDGDIWCIEDGYVDDNYTGLFEDEDGDMFYADEGLVDDSLNGLYKVGGQLYYFDDGQVDTNYYNLAKGEDGELYFVNNGRFDDDWNGMASYNLEWFEIKNGKIDRSYNGDYYFTDGIDKGKQIYYKNGKIIESTFHAGDGDLIVIKNGKEVSSD